MQRELTMDKVGEVYQTSAVVENDFNIHIESDEDTKIIVSLSTVEGGKKSVKDTKSISAGGAFDEDYDGCVFPKYVTITTTSPAEVWLSVRD